MQSSSTSKKKDKCSPTFKACVLELIEGGYYKSSDDVYNHVASELLENVVEETICGIAFELHRSTKVGTFFLENVDKADEAQRVCRDPGFDIFGNPMSKKAPSLDCNCPQCNRTLSSSRFAPHLEKCMGMGRTSSRVASRRIADTGKLDTSYDVADDDLSDKDWTSERKLVRKEKKKSKTANGGSKFNRTRSSELLRKAVTGAAGYGETSDTVPIDAVAVSGAYENMTVGAKKTLLQQSCGVLCVSGRLCARSTKCPQHTDCQRREVRDLVLGRYDDDSNGTVGSSDSEDVSVWDHPIGGGGGEQHEIAAGSSSPSTPSTSDGFIGGTPSTSDGFIESTPSTSDSFISSAPITMDGFIGSMTRTPEELVGGTSATTDGLIVSTSQSDELLESTSSTPDGLVGNMAISSDGLLGATPVSMDSSGEPNIAIVMPMRRGLPVHRDTRGRFRASSSNQVYLDSGYTPSDDDSNDVPRAEQDARH